MSDLPTKKDEAQLPEGTTISGFTRSVDASPAANLAQFLGPFGIDSVTDLPLIEPEEGETGDLPPGHSTMELKRDKGAENRVDLVKLRDMLPEKTQAGLNSARHELDRLIDTIPASIRETALKMKCSKTLEILMKRTEFFARLTSRIARQCKGTNCPVFGVCEYKILDEVRNARPDDDLECLVDREVIRTNVNQHVRSADNPGGDINPDHGGQSMLFEQLVQVLTKQRRTAMHMQQEPMLQKHWEILKKGEVESFQSRNFKPHPLLEEWDRQHTRVEKLIKAMGISPEFQIRQSIWEDEDAGISSEHRGYEIAEEILELGHSDIIQQLPEGSPEREAAEMLSKGIARVVEGKKKRLAEKSEEGS